MRRETIVILACCMLLAAACLPAMAQYTIYGSSIYVGGTYATSWSKSGTLGLANYSDADSSAPGGQVLRARDTSTADYGYLRSEAVLNGIAFSNSDVTAIFRARTTTEATWTTGGVQNLGLCYSVGKGVFVGVLRDRIGLYNTSGSVQISQETNPAIYPMDNSSFHTYYVVGRNATSTGVDCEVYRDGRRLLSGRVNTTVPSALKVGGLYTDQIFMGSNPNTRTGCWRYDRVAYRTGSYIPYGAMDAAGNPVTGTVWDPWSAGTITGIVTDAASYQPVSNAFVELDNGLGVYTAGDGSYTLGVPTTGAVYNITVSAPGYTRQTVSGINVPDATPVSQNVSLSVATFNVSGVITVAGTGTPLAEATVGFSGGSMATTDAAGHYETYLNPGTYNVTVSAIGYAPKNVTPLTINVAGDPVTMNTSLGLIGAPIATISDDFSGILDPSGNPPWILTSPDGYTDVNFMNWAGTLTMSPEDPAHGLSLGGGFLPANFDCTIQLSNLADYVSGVCGITYRQPSPCTYDALHGQTGTPGYFLRCNAAGTIDLWRNGEALATFATGVTNWSVQHQLRAIVYGSRHWILFDGIKIMEVVDTAQMDGGYIGLCRGSMNVDFNSIKVAQLPNGGTSGATATLTGVITDSVSHAPLACAVVKTSDGKFWETGPDGVYTADLPSLDDQNVTAYSPGYAGKTLAVASPQAGSNTLNIALTAGTPVYDSINNLIISARDSAVSILDKVVTAGNDQCSAYFFYIQGDQPGSKGIRVRFPATSKAVHEGDRIDAVGTLVHASDNAYVTNHAGEREIRPDYVWVHPAHEPAAKPVFVRNSEAGGGFFGPNESVSGGPEPVIKGVYPVNEYGNTADGDVGSYAAFLNNPLRGLNNVGTLVTVYGMVTRVCSTDEPTVFDYYISDGSLPYDGWLHATLGINNTNHPAGIRLRVRQPLVAELPAIAVGDKLAATGIVGSLSSSDLSSGNGTRCIRLIRIRKASDIQKLP